MKLFIALILVSFFVGCATVPQGIAPSAKPLVNKKGRINTYEILGQSEGFASHFSLLGFIPLGRADIDEAIQNAVTPLNGDNLINTHYYVTNTWLLIGFSTKITVKGDVVKYTGTSALSKTQQQQEIKNKDTDIPTADETQTKETPVKEALIIEDERSVNLSSTNLLKKSLFKIGKNYIGPSLGLDLSGSSVSFGANYEIGMNLQQLDVDAPGLLGIGGIFRYWSYGFATDIVVAAQGNYHILLDDEKIDPYAGLILGLDFMSYDWGRYWGNDISSSSVGFVIGATGGARYWVSPQMAVNGRFSFGTNLGAMLDVGIDFKF